jgi:hypothetical protein
VTETSTAVSYVKRDTVVVDSVVEQEQPATHARRHLHRHGHLHNKV